VFGEVRLGQGQVVPELLKELGRKNYDLVVTGSSPAEDTLSRQVISDVTLEIVNRVMLPVLVIRTKQRRIIRFFKGVLSRLFGRSHQTSAN
jgi:nucleotide-binding universal stress UspA family protein